MNFSRAAMAARPDVALLPVENTALLTVGIMLASLLQILDTTIANVAIPHMQSALGATSETVNWVLTSYIIASAVAMPITGWLADRIGRLRRLGTRTQAWGCGCPPATPSAPSPGARLRNGR